MTLLLDALDRTLKEPECARRWHALMAIWEATPDDAERKALLQTLEQSPCTDLRSDILRLTFLAGASGESRHEDSAAARVLAAEPGDPDRLAAFMGFRWLVALQDLKSRGDFAASLTAGLLPQMAERLMWNAARTLPPEFVPRAPKTIERVAVVVPYVGNQFHTPSLMALEQALVLAREGRQVRIFSAQELVPPDALFFRGDGRDLNLPALDPSAWARMLPPGVSITISDQRFSLPGRWRSMMPPLAAFDPDVVLLVGLYSPLAAALYAVRPLAGLSVNTVAPIAPVDVWLTGDAGLEVREAWAGVFPPPLPVYHPYRIRRSAKPSSVTRAGLGIGETAVVWITAGFRLAHEIDGEWASRMLQLMAHYPDVVWLLVGGEGKLPQALQQAAPGRIRALAARDDLPGILRCSDIFVNPPRMGGGFSVAEAMAEGLPVTSFAACDGGDKVGDMALSDIDAYMERLAGLTESRELRASTGQAMRRRFAECFDLEASGPALLAALQQAAVLAGRRLGA